MYTSLASTLFVSLVLVACSTGPSSAELTSAPGHPSCDTLAASAAREVGSAIAAHAACSSDADCVTVGFGASCFDACSRMMNIVGTSELSAASERVESAQCKEFAERGCKLIPPPCMAPPAPSCKAGSCG
jgi:hypothetical protein